MKVVHKSKVVVLCLLPAIVTVGMVNFLQTGTGSSIDSKVSNYKYMSKVSVSRDEGRLLCLVLTTRGNLPTKWKAVSSTWGPRCDKTLYVMSEKGSQLRGDSFLLLPVPEGRSHLVAKVRAAFKHVYDNYKHEFDWILKADDDTYVLVENLKHFLSAYNASQPNFAGLLFRHKVAKGFMSGGAGYVISNCALRQLVEVGFAGGHCLADNGDEDVEIGRCLHASGASIIDSLADDGKERFNAYGLGKYFPSYPKWLGSYHWHQPDKDGPCCTEYAISFHYVSPGNMYVYDHLLYKTSIYGRYQSDPGHKPRDRI